MLPKLLRFSAWAGSSGDCSGMRRGSVQAIQPMLGQEARGKNPPLYCCSKNQQVSLGSKLTQLLPGVGWKDLPQCPPWGSFWRVSCSPSLEGAAMGEMWGWRRAHTAWDWYRPCCRPQPTRILLLRRPVETPGQTWVPELFCAECVGLQTWSGEKT